MGFQMIILYLLRINSNLFQFHGKFDYSRISVSYNVCWVTKNYIDVDLCSKIN